MNDQTPDKAKAKAEVLSEGDKIQRKADRKSASENVTDEKQADRYQQNFVSFSDGTAAVSPLVLEDSLTGERLYDAQENKDKVAWDPKKTYGDARQGGLRTDIVRVAELSAATYPFRGREALEVNKIPAARWDEAYSLFPELIEAGVERNRVAEVSKAIVRNELHHYDMWDRADDTAARVTGHPFPLRKDEGDATLGYSQLSPNSITKRCTEFPQLREYLTAHGYPPGAELKALAEPEMAPFLVAANLAHNIKMYERHGISVNERTLAYGFNPDEKDEKGAKILLPDESTLKKSKHVANVMFQLEMLRKGQ